MPVWSLGKPESLVARKSLTEANTLNKPISASRTQTAVTHRPGLREAAAVAAPFERRREKVSSVLRLLAFVLPLGLDSFAVAAALGAAGLTGAGERLRVSVIFVAFEAGMPLVGLAAGGGLARVIGNVADYVAAAAVIGLGIFMLAHGDDEAEERTAGRLRATRGLAVIALGVSISLDEFAIGFSLGLVGLPIVPVVIAIAIVALSASQLGLTLGSRISERFRERAEQLAAITLVLLGAYLLAERVIAH